MSNWIFQGNPKRYPVIEVLERGIAIDNWSVTHSFEDMGKGDRAALWVSGPGGGVIALGQVDGPVGEGHADGDWLDPAERGMPATFCPLRFDRLFWKTPITRAALVEDRRFRGARIIRQPFAGNPFLTTDDEWSAITDRLP